MHTLGLRSVLTTGRFSHEVLRQCKQDVKGKQNISETSYATARG